MVSVGAAPEQLAPSVEPARIVPVTLTSWHERPSALELPANVTNDTVPLLQA